MFVRKLVFSTMAGSVLLVGGLTASAALAAAAPAPGTPAPAVVAGDNWEFVGNYYWESDCNAAGQGMVTRHEVVKYRCDDGSWLPGDDYDLEVVWPR